MHENTSHWSYNLANGSFIQPFSSLKPHLTR